MIYAGRTGGVAGITHHVSWLLNFLVTTFPSSIPSRSTIFCARSWCELPLNTFIFGIVTDSMTTWGDSSLRAMQQNFRSVNIIIRALFICTFKLRQKNRLSQRVCLTKQNLRTTLR